MKKIAFILIFFSGSIAMGQSYFGQKNLIIAGVKSYNLFPYFLDFPVHKNNEVNLTYSRSMSRSVSLALSVGRSNGTFETSGSFNNGPGNAYQPFSVDFKETTVSIHLRSFIKFYGSIAPLGFYLQYNLGIVNQKYSVPYFENKPMTADRELNEYLNNDFRYFTYGLTSGVTRAIGKKFAIDGGISLGAYYYSSPYDGYIETYNFNGPEALVEEQLMILEYPFVKLHLGLGYFF